MSSRRVVVVKLPQDEDQVTALREAGPDLEFVFLDDLSALAPARDDVTAIVGPVSAEEIDALPALDWVHLPSAGAIHDDLDKDLPANLPERGIQVTSASGNGAVPLAEHALLLMMMLNRDVPRWMRAQRERVWDRFVHGELNGKTVGIYGLGHIGTDLAQKAEAFHMNVIGMRRNPERSVPGVTKIFRPDQMQEFVSACDFVVVTAPLTRETAGAFDETAFRAMKPTAYFICVSRKMIAVDEALLRALTEGWIAGAGLDNHATEPLSPESPFWELPNVILTPHNGATTLGTFRRGDAIIAENVARYDSGRPLSNVIDVSIGY